MRHPTKSNLSCIGPNCGFGMICIALIWSVRGRSTVTGVSPSVLPWKTYNYHNNAKIYYTHFVHNWGRDGRDRMAV